MTIKAKATYVITDKGYYLVQIPDNSQWGFSLCSDDQSWPGGVGIATSWRMVDQVPDQVSERLGWILADAQLNPPERACGQCRDDQ